MNYIKGTSIKSVKRISLNGDGSAHFIIGTGANAQEFDMEFDEILEFTRQARDHKCKYEAFVANDYNNLPEVGVMAKPKDWVDNPGYGQITKVEGSYALITYPHWIVNPMKFVRIDDVWLHVSKIELK